MGVIQGSPKSTRAGDTWRRLTSNRSRTPGDLLGHLAGRYTISHLFPSAISRSPTNGLPLTDMTRGSHVAGARHVYRGFETRAHQTFLFELFSLSASWTSRVTITKCALCTEWRPKHTMHHNHEERKPLRARLDPSLPRAAFATLAYSR